MRRRLAWALLSLASLASLAVLGFGCDGFQGYYRPIQGPGVEADAGDLGDVDAAEGGDAAPSDAGADANLNACVDRIATLDTGNHNPGQACMPCHTLAGGAPVFNLAGTLYTPGGAAPSVGATIRIIDANNKVIQLTTSQNGNFYSFDTMVFPVHVKATACPTITPMAGAVDTAGGNCNSAGCHDANMRIVL